MVALSDALFLFGQAACLSVLAWGCYLSLRHARLNDKERGDPKVAGEMAFLLYANQRRRSS